MHHDSHIPARQKKNIFTNELHRRRSKCSTPQLAEEATISFKTALEKRGYSARYINNIESSTNIRRRRNLPNKIYYLNIPFINSKVDTQIINLFRRKGIFVRLSRKTQTLFDILRPKRETILNCNLSSCSINNNNICFNKNVVYQVSCSGCNKKYIGHTKRFLHSRIGEHNTGHPSSKISPHLIECGNNNFSATILSKQKDCVDAKLSESIYIHETQPALNSRNEAENLF